MALDHIPILSSEISAFLLSNDPELLVDGTVGGGGHLEVLLRESHNTALIGFDRDPDIVGILQERYRDEPRVRIELGSYTMIPAFLAESRKGNASGALFDLGLSSIQLDDPARGFSYRLEGPLDMRFGRNENCPTAGEVLNEFTERDLADIFFRFGEEHRSRAVARNIVRRRPLSTTTDLARAVRSSVRGNPIKALSRVFQALRIFINGELDHLAALLSHMHEWLIPGGGAAFITFHSLEDRLVKHFFRDSQHFLPTKPPWVVPSPREKKLNSRARSARLRTGVRV